MIVEFLKVFYTLIFVWLAGLTALFMLTRTASSTYRVFLLFIICMAIAETIGNYQAFRGIKNHWYFNLYYIIQFMTVPVFYYQWLKPSVLKKLIPVFLGIFLLFIVADILWLQAFENLLTYVFVTGGSFLLVLAGSWLWQLYTSEEVRALNHYPVFWFSLAYLFYYSIALPYIGMLNYLWASYPDFTKKYYFVFNMVIILHNIFLITGFLCLKTTTTKP